MSQLAELIGSRNQKGQDLPRTLDKLEGAAIVGHRTVFIGGIRDPILIDQIDGVRRHAAAPHAAVNDGTAQMIFQGCG